MCGLAGICLADPVPWAREAIGRMTDSLSHRGPDSDGFYESTAGDMYLGFRRLAIRDLDERANQPMQSASGRLSVVFNGEVYNTEDLGHKFCSDKKLRTTSDTEVFLESFEARGSEVFDEANAMFAVAFYDVPTGTLTLARDRMGKKPLYIYEGDGFLAFASELRAFRQFGLEPDPSKAPYYFHFGYMPSPHTFFKRTSQVCPGEVVTVRAGQIVSRRRFFHPANLNWCETEQADIDQLDDTLASAVSLRTLSDVPVGAFLSGGIDSTLVAAQMKATGHQNIPTFTIAFDDPRYNEAPHAAATAMKLGLSHTTIPINEQRLADLVTDYTDCYEQPYMDKSGLPTMLLCQEVKQYVTVALSGDGGDEFFMGYERYNWYRQVLRAQLVPPMARRLMQQIAPRVDKRRGNRIQRLLESTDSAGLYANLIRNWLGNTVSDILCEIPEADEMPIQLVRDVFSRADGDPIAKAACFDATYYIPDDLQVKMDRASMRVALEVRCPMLDHRVTRLGAQLSTTRKFAGGLKCVLKSLLGRHVPREMFERPKQGFAVPMDRWMRGPLRDALHDTLSQRSIRECGWLNTRRIDDMLRLFESGHSELNGSLWMLFVLSKSLGQWSQAQQSRAA
ncbi:MAG: asparagine synthase (glutamine-hydrolyzing) [Planctomycetaceae bacterium]|nr:asparagine synthase (glutamine-hydrolyzing) [Planctomycetaceae bacterium]